MDGLVSFHGRYFAASNGAIVRGCAVVRPKSLMTQSYWCRKENELNLVFSEIIERGVYG